MDAYQQEFWNGPEQLPDGFQAIMPRGPRTMTATCEVWTHPVGWELRLIIDGGTLMATVVASASEMRALVAAWRAAMQKHGWQ